MREARKQAIDVAVQEAIAFYRLIVTTATVFLSGSLLFWEKFLPAINAWSIFLVTLGWMSLAGSIMLIAQVRRQNVELARLGLAEKWDKYDELERKVRCAASAAIYFLAGGMLSVALSGTAALIHVAIANTNTEGTNMSKQPDTTKIMPIKEILRPTAPEPTKPGTGGDTQTK